MSIAAIREEIIKGLETKGALCTLCRVESEGNPGSGSPPLKGAPKPVMWPRLQLDPKFYH